MHKRRVLISVLGILVMSSNVIAGQSIERKLAGDCPACFTPEDMERFAQIMSKPDRQAAGKMLDTGVCVMFKKGQSVFVDDRADSNMSSSIIPIRARGQHDDMWTVSAYTMGILGTFDKP